MTTTRRSFLGALAAFCLAACDSETADRKAYDEWCKRTGNVEHYGFYAWRSLQEKPKERDIVFIPIIIPVR